MSDSPSPAKPSFLFITCQVGAEPAVKAELAGRWPDFRFAYSRPGFLTFKLPADVELADDFNLRSVFARSYGFSLGKVAGQTVDELARGVAELVKDQTFEQVHVWPRDAAAAGEHGYTPALSRESAEADVALRRHLSSEILVGTRTRPPADSGQRVLDCVMVQPREWWIGYHRAASRMSRLPGGLSEIELPSDAVSRAYLKMEESLRWAALPLAEGDRCVEIGCAPGGSCQALLEHGLVVTGIDPAAMPARLLEHARFRHLRKRSADVRRSEFKGTRWLMADMNVAPQYTLDAVEEIVTDPRLNVRGLLLTLKLLEWSLAEHLDEYVERVRAWGFPNVRVRQLQYNRQEVCLAALKGRFGKPRRLRTEAANRKAESEE